MDTVWSKPEIRAGFFNAYPNAVGTVIEDLPSNDNHCGVCHWSFDGGGQRNPHGNAVQSALQGIDHADLQAVTDAIWSIRNDDPDGDGYSTLEEVNDPSAQYGNDPTFPGLTLGNVGEVKNVNVAEIEGHLVPIAGADNTPPTVTVIAPNGGELVTANTPYLVQWSATDDSGTVATIDLFVSLDNGATFTPVAFSLSNTGSYSWIPPNRPTTQALFWIIATDNSANAGDDLSDAVFDILSPVHPSIIPSTLRDFDMPGTQPLEVGAPLEAPAECGVCHGGYNPDTEPYANWQGSMMANASIDPLFKANMVIANQDVPEAGDICLRCHFSKGWLEGRSVPTDGSSMIDADKAGVSCELCHRMVDPIADAENPDEDASILAMLTNPPSVFGTGSFVIDPDGRRRGPFVDATSGHSILVSPFHREAAFCGTCHDVSNPAFEKDGQGNYTANAFDVAATDFSATNLVPVERTYSEWFNSAYNTPTGVYAPEFGGNLDYVATCQDCHMRDIDGYGCDPASFAAPHRTDLPLHDMTGGSTWVPSVLGLVAPNDVNEPALQAGIARARYMLQNAAELDHLIVGDTLKVTVTNNTGHKLPTGYPEGRRIWLNVQFYNPSGVLLAESGAYDAGTGVLSHDAEVKIYEIEPIMDPNLAALTGNVGNEYFHFVLGNKIHKDNRIPPRGFTNVAFAEFGGSPVGHSYDDGQYWDDSYYTIPADANTAVVTLYYQSTSKEFIEFLRDENTTNSEGLDLYNLWNENGKCPPEMMETLTIDLDECQYAVRSDLNNDCVVDIFDLSLFASDWLVDCWQDPENPACVPK